MSSVNFAKPIILTVTDKQGNPASLQGSFGMDDWKNPSEFAVRLDYIAFRDGERIDEPIARFDHNGHDVFIDNPPSDGFHIDVYENKNKQKFWLQTPPPFKNLHDVFDYCRTRLYPQDRAEYLYRVWCGEIPRFRPRLIGLSPY